MVPKSVTLNDLERHNGVILRYFSEFGYLPGALRKSSRSLSHLLMNSCSKWQPSAMLDLQTSETLFASRIQRVKMRRRVKFLEDRSNRCRDSALKRFSKWRPFTILDFYRLGFVCMFVCVRFKCNVRHFAKFRVDRSKPLLMLTYGDFSIFFQNGGRPQSWSC